MTSIGSRAFSGCHDLTSISIPDAVTSIGNDAFSGCTGLTNITVDANNQYFSSVDGILFDKAQTTLILCPISKALEEYSIPDSVTSIGKYAFYGCESLTSIQYGGTVAQWNAIEKNFPFLVATTKIICSDGEISL